jgi:hypothetical protein
MEVENECNQRKVGKRSNRPSPTDWPEGCRLIVEALPAEEKYSLSEEEWPRDPEAIAEWVKWFDSFEPVEFTQEEEAKTPVESPPPG